MTMPRSIAGLKGKTVGWSTRLCIIQTLGEPHGEVSSALIHTTISVGWRDSDTDPMTFSLIGKSMPSWPPRPRRRNSATARSDIRSSTASTDRPWSQYFCCMLIGRTEFVQKYPIATKRVVRAILKATDLCANEPERMARLMVERGFTPRYDYALQIAARAALRSLARL